MPDAFRKRLSQSLLMLKLKLPSSAVNVEPTMVDGESAGEAMTLTKSMQPPSLSLTNPSITLWADVVK